MCAIFGLGLLRDHIIRNNEMVRSFIRTMFTENEARGHTASGIAYISTNEFKIIKTNVRGSEFINLPEYDTTEEKYMDLSVMSNRIRDGLEPNPPLAVIGHCRLKTKGTELRNINNHPIVRNSIVGVHNGCINNDDELFEQYDKAFSRKGRVDSEIIFALIEHFAGENTPIHRAIQKMSVTVSGSFACAMSHRMQPHVIWLFRRNNPCDVVLFKDVGLVVWSTSGNYIVNAAKQWPALGKGEIIKLEADSGLGIDLYRNKMHHFDVARYHYGNKTNSAE